MPTKLAIATEAFPIRGVFAISRGAKTKAEVVTVRLRRRGAEGWGECVPYGRYGESLESVTAAIDGLRCEIEAGADREAVQKLLPPGAARNAVDCAMWDLEAKLSGVPAYQAAGLPEPKPLTTAYTLSVGTPDEMFAAACAAAGRPLLKIKLAGAGDPERLAAVRAGAPGAQLIVDANEAWREENLLSNMEACAKAGVILIEQPLPAGDDAGLGRIERIVPVCADESVHDRVGLAELKDRYDAVNIKLDKTGGLTEALAVAEKAKELGFRIMAGCMVGSSLAMAPAVLVGQLADFVDLDGPLLLDRDREPGLRYEGSAVWPPLPDLWG